MKTVIFLPVEGEPEIREISGELADYQAMVGGYIEHFNNRAETLDIYLNEDGKALGLPYNSLATDLMRDNLMFGDYIAGDVVVIGTTDSSGNTLSVNLKTIKLIRRYRPGLVDTRKVTA